MAERYSKLFGLPGGLYAQGAPVLVCAGSLLRDNLSGNYVCQLKYYNLSSLSIREMTVMLRFLDNADRPIGEELARVYKEQNAEPDTEFGQRTALRVPFRNACSFTLRVSKVVFSDGTGWEDAGVPWSAVEARQTLEEFYGDEELASQFRVHYGHNCQYAPAVSNGIWYCTCGAVNLREQKTCRRCRRVLKTLLAVNVDSLRSESNKRLAHESMLLQAEEERPPRHGGFFKTFLVILIALLAVALVIFYVPRLLNEVVPLPTFPPIDTSLPAAEPSPAVRSVPAPAEPGKPDATPAPMLTPEPTLSPAQRQEQTYSEALTLLKAGSYSAARNAFQSLGDYKDSETMAKEAVYRKAAALYSFIEANDEEGIYALISMDGAGTNRFALSSEKALALGSSVITQLRSACGKDPVDVTLSEASTEGLNTLGDCVKELFAYLGDYKDSAELLANLDEMTDYTRNFYMLCEAGDIFGAYTWLENYCGDFIGRDHWLQLLNLYKPYCDDWVLYAGDPTLLPMTVDHQFPCMSFNSRVLISGDVATLRFLIREGESEFTVDLPAEVGTTTFVTSNYSLFYFASVSQVDHMAYLKYLDGAILGSCEYERAR